MGRYGTDRLGYADTLGAGRKYPGRVWRSRAARAFGRAVVQLRNATEGGTYFDAKKAAGKTSMEAMRALVYAQMRGRPETTKAAGVGAHPGTTLQSSVTDLTPNIGSSDKPLPEPASSQPKPAIAAVS